MDTVTAKQRSKNMAAIRSINTKPELYLRKLLFTNGYRYRLYKKNLPGKPDLWLAKYNTAIFINGCFWHRHKNCKYASTPKSNTEYWESKFQRNLLRDEKVRSEILSSGLRMLIVWECTIKNMMKDKTYETKILKEIDLFLNNRNIEYQEI